MINPDLDLEVLLSGPVDSNHGNRYITLLALV